MNIAARLKSRSRSTVQYSKGQEKTKIGKQDSRRHKGPSNSIINSIQNIKRGESRIGKESRGDRRTDGRQTVTS